MLNQNDRRRLEEIERQLRGEDPEFVRRFTQGPPPRGRIPRFWLVLMVVVGSLGMVVSILTVLPAVLLLSMAATVAGCLWLRRRNGPGAG